MIYNKIIFNNEIIPPIMVYLVKPLVLLFLIKMNIFNQNPPYLLSIPVIQDWIFSYPPVSGARALKIGIGLGIVATSFRIIIGLDRSFLGE